MRRDLSDFTVQAYHVWCITGKSRCSPRHKHPEPGTVRQFCREQTRHSRIRLADAASNPTTHPSPKPGGGMSGVPCAEDGWVSPGLQWAGDPDSSQWNHVGSRKKMAIRRTVLMRSFPIVGVGGRGAGRSRSARFSDQFRQEYTSRNCTYSFICRACPDFLQSLVIASAAFQTNPFKKFY